MDNLPVVKGVECVAEFEYYLVRERRRHSSAPQYLFKRLSLNPFHDDAVPERAEAPEIQCAADVRMFN